MTSDRKINANRANSRASTGPQTVQGCARVARNAFRHGLSLPVCSDPGLSEEMEALAREIAGTDDNAEIQELARQIAEPQIDLRRVRYARHQVLSDALSDRYYDSHASVRIKMKVIGKILRGRAPEDMSMEALTKYVTSTPEGPEKFALILSQEAKQLLAMDRYERRALLRRKIAIRAFDEVRVRLNCVIIGSTTIKCAVGRTKPN